MALSMCEGSNYLVYCSIGVQLFLDFGGSQVWKKDGLHVPLVRTLPSTTVVWDMHDVVYLVRFGQSKV